MTRTQPFHFEERVFNGAGYGRDVLAFREEKEGRTAHAIIIIPRGAHGASPGFAEITYLRIAGTFVIEGGKITAGPLTLQNIMDARAVLETPDMKEITGTSAEGFSKLLENWLPKNDIRPVTTLDTNASAQRPVL